MVADFHNICNRQAELLPALYPAYKIVYFRSDENNRDHSW